MLDLATLRVIWWVLVGVLFIGFALTDGFDMGVAALLPFVARNESERRVVINTVGPVWEGNQVWIIVAAGAVFAAWPYVYAVAFSGAYFAVLLLLLTMGIARPVGFKYRSKLSNAFWRSFWDGVIVLGGWAPAILFGILVGNILRGLPFYFDTDLRIVYTGNLSYLFHPFALGCGLLGLMMFLMHGGLFLAIKTYDPIRKRAIAASRLAAIVVIVLFAVGGVWVSQHLMGYQITSEVDPNGFSNPLHKTVTGEVGAWMHNYARYPIFILMPALGFLGALAVLLITPIYHSRPAFICSGASLFGIIGTVGVSLFPFILPSSAQPDSSLLVWDASSSRLTLLIMLGATIIFLPIILFYTTWVYYVLRGKVEIKNVKDNKQAY